MKRSLPLFFALTVLAALACSKDDGDQTPAPSPPSLTGTWDGQFMFYNYIIPDSIDSTGSVDITHWELVINSGGTFERKENAVTVEQGTWAEVDSFLVFNTDTFLLDFYDKNNLILKDQEFIVSDSATQYNTYIYVR